jgi:PAS domain S-box-containing protein
METEKIKILLYESVEGSLSSIENALKDSNYRTSSVEKAKVVTSGFDLVFSRWGDGFKLVNELKKCGENTPLIVLTEMKNRKEGTELMCHGAFAYLIDPVDSVELEALISRACEKKQLISEAETAHQTAALYNVSQALGSIMKLTDALKMIMKIACEAAGANGGTIMLFDRKAQELEIKVAAGEDSEKVIGLKFKPGQRVSGRSVLEGRAILIKDYQKIESDPRFRGMKVYGNTKSSMSVPMFMKGQTIGVISLKITQGEKRFNENDVKLVSIFAGNAAFSIENARVYEEIASAKAYIENIIKSMIDTLIIINPDGTIKSINRAMENLLDYREEQLAGLPADVIFQNTEDNPFKGDKLKELIEAGSVQNRELVYITRNGEDVPVMFSGSALHDEAGATLGIVGVAKDMRDVKKLQDDLLQSRKLASIGELGTGIAHELNSPLAGLLMLVDVLLRRTPKEDRNYPLLEETKTAIKFCKDIVAGLLAFSHAPKGKFASVNCNEAIDGILSFMGHQLEVRNIKITRNLAADLPNINGDMSQIQQVFLNMITNARDSMPGGGEITITTRSSGREVLILFSDKGCGIPRENLQKIFDPFFSTKPRGEGTGLGLATSIGIVQMHKGRIEVDSEVGIGTTFKIIFPAIPASDAPASAAPGVAQTMAVN